MKRGSKGLGIMGRRRAGQAEGFCALWYIGSTCASVGGGGRRARSTSASPAEKGEKGFRTTTSALMLSQPLPQPCAEGGRHACWSVAAQVTLFGRGLRW